MSDSLPVLGAALKVADLPARAAWLLADQRDLEIQDPCRRAFLESDWHPLAAQARTVLNGYTGRLGVHAPYAGMACNCPDKRIAGVIRDRLRESLDFTAALGGSHLVLHSPFEFYGTAQAVHRGADLARTIDLARENLAPVVEQAAAQQCVLVFENTFDLRPEPLDALVRSFESRWVRRSLDTGHANLMRARGAPPADVWADVAGELLAHVHLDDNDGESDRHWAVGEGTIAWTAMFRALARLPARPRLILEMPPEKLDPSLAWLAARGLAR